MRCRHENATALDELLTGGPWRDVELTALDGSLVDKKSGASRYLGSVSASEGQLPVARDTGWTTLDRLLLDEMGHGSLHRKSSFVLKEQFPIAGPADATDLNSESLQRTALDDMLEYLQPACIVTDTSSPRKTKQSRSRSRSRKRCTDKGAGKILDQINQVAESETLTAEVAAKDSVSVASLLKWLKMRSGQGYAPLVAQQIEEHTQAHGVDWAEVMGELSKFFLKASAKQNHLFCQEIMTVFEDICRRCRGSQSFCKASRHAFLKPVGMRIAKTFSDTQREWYLDLLETGCLNLLLTSRDYERLYYLWKDGT